MPPRDRVLVVTLVAAALAGCNQTASTPSSPGPAAGAASLAPGVTPPGFQMPTGQGCAGDIARFRAVLKNDVDAGNLGQGVFKRASVDLDQADTACAAGREQQARMIVFSARRTYGYPG